jgi:predicted permease
LNSQFGLIVPQMILDVCERVASTVIPLALVCVGFQLYVEPSKLRIRASEVSVGLTYKLILSPILAWFLCWIWNFKFPVPHEFTRITILESGMSPMITAAIICGQMGLDEELASLLVGIGTLLSLVTIPLWALVL